MATPNKSHHKSYPQTSWGVVLLDLRSRENVGSIFRTADAAGVSKIFLCGITPRPPHEKISKTALGAEESVEWEYHSQAWRLLDRLKKEGHRILFLEQSPQSKNIFEYDSRRLKEDKNFNSEFETKKDPELSPKGDQKTTPNGDEIQSLGSDKKWDSKNGSAGLILVVGNEVAGISKKLFNYASDVVEIPMMGSKESLNVAVAFGVAIFTLISKKA